MSVEWTGMEELKEALRHLPADLTAEAGHIIEGAGNAAAATIKAGYPVLATPQGPKSNAGRPGELRDKLVVEKVSAGQFGAAVVVKNTSKLAHLFENGTQARHSAFGNRGAMPANHLFLSTVIRRRRQMVVDLKAMVERKGLTVSGDA